MEKFILSMALICLIAGCATQRKVGRLNSEGISAQLVLPQENDIPELSEDYQKRDTIQVEDQDGTQTLIMKAVRDENGEMVATDVIDAATVTARFRNVAERHGNVDLRFQVLVPGSMQDSRWQLRLQPVLSINADSTMLDQVVITGKDYRKAQLRGYQQYERFLSSIVTDSSRFLDRFQLEIFLKRNIPQIYRFRDDSTYVSDEQFSSAYGVTQQKAVEHYTRGHLIRSNDRRIANKEKMFHKYVKVPIRTEGLRLDTLIQNLNGDFIYDYVQTIPTRRMLRKADIILSGAIYEQDDLVYKIPESRPLTFYISSLSSLVDNTERYMTKVIERRAEENTACYIDFKAGDSEIVQDLGENIDEIGRIKGNLAALLENEQFDMDSIIVSASCSPEGDLRYNEKLSQRRSDAAAQYFKSYILAYQDSAGLRRDGTSIRFIPRKRAENWRMLDALVKADTTLTMAEKTDYSSISAGADLDQNEMTLQKRPYYLYMRESLYPKLRTVRFGFYLHRKGMVQDTIHTTVPDTVYMKGVQAIRDRDYKEAVSILRPYNDFNSAVAYCAMDYNESAMSVLSSLPPTGMVNYLLAILLSRKGDYHNAVEHYLEACSQNGAFVHRGNLDPEISALIKRYQLNEYEN